MVTTATRETHLTGTDGEGSGLKSFLVTEKGKSEFETFDAKNGDIKVGLKPAKEGNEIVYEIYGLDKVGNKSKIAIELIVKNVDSQGANVIELVGTPDNETAHSLCPCIRAADAGRNGQIYGIKTSSPPFPQTERRSDSSDDSR